MVSTALKMMDKVIQERYSQSLWNIYGAQASDGDNWQEDSFVCQGLMDSRIMPQVQYFAYVEIAEGRPQNLWREYEQVRGSWPDSFAQRRLTSAREIYPVFHDLFRKQA